MEYHYRIVAKYVSRLLTDYLSFPCLIISLFKSLQRNPCSILIVSSTSEPGFFLILQMEKFIFTERAMSALLSSNIRKNTTTTSPPKSLFLCNLPTTPSRTRLRTIVNLKKGTFFLLMYFLTISRSSPVLEENQRVIY